MATQISNPEHPVATRLPSTMSAVVYRGVNDMRVETVPVPRIGAGELLVKIARRVVVAHPGALRLIFRSKKKHDRIDVVWLWEGPERFAVKLPRASARETVTC